MDDNSELSPEMTSWIASETGAVRVSAERRSAGGSRAGFAVDIQRDDGIEEALWLRMDLGYGPLSNTPFTLRREAAVYGSLQGTAVRVPHLVAVHPTDEAFLMRRVEGRNWFAEIKDPERAVAIASDFMAQIAAALHKIDPSAFHLPGFEQHKPVSAYVEDEIDIWERVHLDGAAEREPLVMMAAAWLRRHLPDDTGTSVVFVQGDTGPGNFMYRDDRVAAFSTGRTLTSVIFTTIWLGSMSAISRSGSRICRIAWPTTNDRVAVSLTRADFAISSFWRKCAALSVLSTLWPFTTPGARWPTISSTVPYICGCWPRRWRA